MQDIPGYEFFGYNNYRSEDKSEAFEAIVNPFKKPFMPTSWKWFRTSGQPKIYTYVAKRGESTTLTYTIPTQFRKYIISKDGASFEGNTITMEGDTGDYFTTGNRISVNLFDADSTSPYSNIPIRRTVTFPQFEFRTDGVDYKLDWNYFAQTRNVALGAWDEDWGYPREGKPTYGVASMYDSDIKLSWNRKIKWWWLLIGVGAIALLTSLFRKKKV